MAKFGFQIKKADLEDPEAPRRPPHIVVGMEGGGSPFGSTRYKRTRLCPFEQALVSVARLRPLRNKEALDVGWLVHAALQRYYETFIPWHKAPPPPRSEVDAYHHYLWGARPAAEKAARDLVEQIAHEPGYAATYEEVLRVVAAYVDQYRADEWRIIACEETIVYTETLETPFVFTDAEGTEIRQEEFAYSCRLDILVERLEPGKAGLWDVEIKTARMINDDLLTGYQLDMQILGQAWLIHKCLDLSVLPPFKGVLVNIMSKAKTPKFERIEVMPSVYHLREFERSTRQWAFMNACFETAGYPRALGACAGALRGYSKCGFYELCHSHPELGVEDWKNAAPPFGFYREERDLEDYVTEETA